MGNYLQFDPRLPRAQAPRGLAPQNVVKSVTSGNVQPWFNRGAKPLGVAPGPGMPGYGAGAQTIQGPYIHGTDGGSHIVNGVDHSPLYRHLGIPVPGATTHLAAGGPMLPFGGASGLAIAPSTRPSFEDLRMPVRGPVAPSDTGIPEPPAPGITAPPIAPQPQFNLPMIPRVNGAVPPMTPHRSDYYPTAPTPAVPFQGSPLARQGTPYFPSTPIGQMLPDEARAQVPSAYGVGTANGYVSRPGARVPLSSLATAGELSMLNRDANAGPFGSLGGSSSRAGAMQALVAQQQAQAGGLPPISQPHPWNPALMAQIQAQSADRTDPRTLADLNNAAMRATPQYQANRARQLDYNTQRDQRLARNRGDAALARGIAQSRASGIPLSPAQNDLLFRGREAMRGNAVGGFAGGGPVGTGLNAPPRPFAALQSTPKVTEMAPERQQQLLTLLEGINDRTPAHELHRIRGMIQPGELEYLTSQKVPTFPWSDDWDAFNRMSENIRRLRGTYQPPAQAPQVVGQGMYDSARGNSMVQF